MYRLQTSDSSCQWHNCCNYSAQTSVPIPGSHMTATRLPCYKQRFNPDLSAPSSAAFGFRVRVHMFGAAELAWLVGCSTAASTALRRCTSWDSGSSKEHEVEIPSAGCAMLPSSKFWAAGVDAVSCARESQSVEDIRWHREEVQGLVPDLRMPCWTPWHPTGPAPNNMPSEGHVFVS